MIAPQIAQRYSALLGVALFSACGLHIEIPADDAPERPERPAGVDHGVDLAAALHRGRGTKLARGTEPLTPGGARNAFDDRSLGKGFRSDGDDDGGEDANDGDESPVVVDEQEELEPDEPPDQGRDDAEAEGSTPANDEPGPVVNDLDDPSLVDEPADESPPSDEPATVEVPQDDRVPSGEPAEPPCGNDEPVFENPEDHLRLYLPLDGDSADASRSALLTRPSGDFDFEAGQAGTAGHFRGGANFVDVEGVTGLGVGEAFTAAAWVNMDDWRNPYPYSSHDESILNHSTDLGIHVDFDTWAVWAYATIGDDFVLVRGGSVPPGSWHHVALSYDGAELSLAVDGEVAGSALAAGPVHFYPDDPRGPQFRVGTWCGLEECNGNEAASALIDEVRLYDVALPAREVMNAPAVAPR